MCKFYGAFDGDAITSNGGVALPAVVEWELGLAERLASCFTGCRAPDSIKQAMPDLPRQRTVGITLARTKQAVATCGTVWLKLLQLGARVTISVRRVELVIASSCPDAAVFAMAARRLRF